MARPLRIEFEGAWYHVMNRGLGRRNIFLTDADRQMLLKLLGETSQIFHIEIHAYSLMDNHYHLLVHTPLGGLGRAMRHINGVYTQKWNKVRKSDGPLFRGRYKARLVDSEEYLTQLVRYIHLNPVKAQVCRQPGAHTWTSHQAYLYRGKRPSWLVTDEVLSRFSSAEKMAKQRFHEFVMAGVPEQIAKHIEQERVFLGTDGFKEWVQDNFLGKNGKPLKEVPIRDKKQRRQPSPKKILELVAHAYNVKVSDLRNSQRGIENQARAMAAYLLRQTAGLSQRAIASWVRFPSEYAVAASQKRLQVRLEKEKRLLELYKQLACSAEGMYQVKT